ncbi:MAG: hypothetical protein IJF13_06595 [Clostridia bacterium]|nr:hypothetical protein [Clostridia bacterium]
MDKTIYFSAFGGEDTLSRLSLAMEEAGKVPGTTLVIEPGEYIITTPLAKQVMSSCISGAYGANPETSMFRPSFEYSKGMDFCGHKGTRVVADGVKFIVDGFMEPVSIRDCEDVTLEGLTIDHLRRPFSVGRVIRSTNLSEEEAHIDVLLEGDSKTHITPKTPVNLRNLYYDPLTQRLEVFPMEGCRGVAVSDGLIRYTGKNLRRNIVGCEVYIWHSYNFRPAILMERGKNITLRNVTVHSQPGMGITGNDCENILIDGFRAIPGEGLQVSTNTDAARFTACKGDLTVINSTFVAEGGSAVNVHGYYHAVLIVDGDRHTVRMEAPSGTHTNTPDYPRVGDIMEVCLSSSLETVGTRRVTDVSVRPGTFISDINFDVPLPINALEIGMFVSNINALPRLRFENNYCRGNFSAAVVCRTRNAVISGNTFEDVMGTPIYISADAKQCAGVAPADITVESNVMRRCGHRSSPAFGIGGIEVGVAAEEQPSVPQIRNVKIIDNKIDSPDTGVAISIKSVDGLVLGENINTSSVRDLVVENCNNITVKN